VENNFCVDCNVLCSGKFCWKCGKVTIPMLLACPHCKADVSVLSKFCENCGKPIHEAAQEHIKRGREKGGDKV